MWPTVYISSFQKAGVMATNMPVISVPPRCCLPLFFPFFHGLRDSRKLVCARRRERPATKRTRAALFCFVSYVHVFDTSVLVTDSRSSAISLLLFLSSPIVSPALFCWFLHARVFASACGSLIIIIVRVRSGGERVAATRLQHTCVAFLSLLHPSLLLCCALVHILPLTSFSTASRGIRSDDTKKKDRRTVKRAITPFVEARDVVLVRAAPTTIYLNFLCSSCSGGELWRERL